MSELESIDSLESVSLMPDSILLDMLCSDIFTGDIDTSIIETSLNNTNTRTNPKQEESMSIKCTECGADDSLVNDISNGIVVCKQCGQVSDNIINMSAEWRNYDNTSGGSSAERCKTITNPHLPKSSLGTSIAGKYNTKLKTLNGWNAMPYEERSLNIVLKKIQKHCRKSNILKCIEDDAKIMYKNISMIRHITGKNKGSKVIFRGINREGLIAACVFYACVRKGKTRAPSELAIIFEIGYTDMTNGMKLFHKLLRMISKSDITFKIQSSLPEHFIPRYCQILKINKELTKNLITINRNIQNINMASTHTPKSIAVGSIWLIIDRHNIPITKRYIAKLFKISEVTISKTFNIIKPYYDILIDNNKTSLILKKLNSKRSTITLPLELQEKYNIITLDINKDINSTQINLKK